MNTAREASTPPWPGQIPGTRDPPARGRRAPPRSEDSMGDTETNRPEPHEIAFLRGGPRAAVTVAVLDLHLRGAVEAGRAGTMRTARALAAAGRPVPVLTKAVHSALYRPAGLRQLMDRRGVREALTELRRELVAAGLLRGFLPGPTVSGRRERGRLRDRAPLPASRTGLSDDELLLAVALYGDRALTALVPRFAGEAGLVGRSGTTEPELRQSWGGSDGSGLSCGTT
ncbi:TIGR04222 domain-containing membrane protein [Streptomyces sp. NPDC004096]|uniref:TIGR04222 domain-containing membrane protein n=1 Tax=Streptomyces sp. NPDC004074 TaxID=3154277 RepID=UPI0033A959FF